MSDQWYVARRGPDGNKRYGPVPLHELRAMVDAGRVIGEDLVWQQGMAEWQRVDQCPSIAPPRPLLPAYPPDPRGNYGPPPGFDDRPRPYPPRRRSSGAVVALVVGGIVLLVGLIAGGGGFGYYMLNYRTWAIKAAAASPYTPLADPGNVLTYGSSELHYTANVNPMEASSLGAYLSKIGYLSGDRGVLVQLDSDPSGNFIVRCCIDSAKTYDPSVGGGFEKLRNDLEMHVFYAPTNVELCDESMQLLRTFPSPDYVPPPPQ